MTRERVDENMVDKAIHAVQQRKIPEGPSATLLEQSKRAIGIFSQIEPSHARLPTEKSRLRKFSRFWPIALAASAALFIFLMVSPRLASASLFSRAMDKFSTFRTLKMRTMLLHDGT